MKTFFLTFTSILICLQFVLAQEKQDTTKKVIRIGNLLIENNTEGDKEGIILKLKKEKSFKDKKVKLEEAKLELENQLENFDKNSEAYEGLEAGIKGLEEAIKELDNINSFCIEDIEDQEECNNFDPHFAGITLGINNFMNKNQSMNFTDDEEVFKLNTSRSWYISFNIFDLGIPFNKSSGRNTIGLGTGLGMEWHNYHFDNEITLDKIDGQIVGKPNFDNKNFDKNKLTVSYLTVPLFFEMQFPSSKEYDERFFISFGGFAGVKLFSYTNQKYTLDGKDEKEKKASDYYLNPFKYGVSARIGYRFLDIFANYNLSTLFEKNKAPELYPFTIGIALFH